MILIGQYDSPFVRRVGIALTLYGLPFEHRPWSTFGDAEKVRQYNPLIRVPTLVLEDAEVLIESHCILDYLDSLVPEGKRLFPVLQPQRRRALHVAAIATGMADKAVTLFYEGRMHKEVSQTWVARCKTQILTALQVLEQSRSSLDSGRPYWFGSTPGHADIAVACAWRFVQDAHPGLTAPGAFPALLAHSEHLEGLPVFQQIFQRFIPPS